jgi:hypothetical protein
MVLELELKALAYEAGTLPLEPQPILIIFTIKKNFRGKNHNQKLSGVGIYFVEQFKTDLFSLMYFGPYFLFPPAEFFFFFPELGFKLTAYTLSHSTSPFCDGFFEIGCRQLFAHAGFTTILLISAS